MKVSKKVVFAAGVAIATAAGSTSVSAQQQFFSIGTGGVTGVYYPTGGAICRLVNQNRRDHGFRCSVESTGGSIFNINTVRSGELEFGVAQSDWQFHAYNGTSRFEEAGAFEDLRAVFSVHPEPFTLIVPGDSEVDSFDDLKGLRVNVGNPGSGQRATMEVVMAAFGIEMSDFAVATEFQGAEMAQALCNGQIDAMIYTVGHPAAAITEVSTTCDAKLIDVTGPEIDKLIEDNSYYRTAVIPGGMYNGTDEDVTTFGVGATFITSAAVDEEIVYTVVKGVFDNFSDFTGLHPAFNNLSEDAMISDGLSAPLHDGAVRYYRERGWVE
ncbi:MAG: TAXI family TRAP transporter solute-binding subunit [Pseudomonadota bacterium]